VFSAPLQVVLLDREQQLGGNSAKASSGINAAPSSHQQRAKVLDSWDLLANDTLTSATCSIELEDQDELAPYLEKLVETLAQNSADALAFLEEIGQR
jgi:succinate dehydrogenase/fumarate reductase flavoprotein subunit